MRIVTDDFTYDVIETDIGKLLWLEGQFSYFKIQPIGKPIVLVPLIRIKRIEL